LIGGLVVALAAAACYEGGYVLQALEAREAPAHEAMRPSLLRRLAGRPRWLGGTALALVGAALQVWALTLAPVTVVQPVLALGLVALLALAHFVLGERVGPREWLAVALVVGGVTAVGTGAPPRSGAVQSDAALVALLVVLGVLAAAPYVRRRAGSALAGAAAGDALAAIALKLVADAAADGRWPLAAAWAALAALAGSAALTAEMSALQAVAASRVAPVVVAAQVVVPAAAGALVFGEHLSATPLGGAVVVGGIAATALGAALLSASRGVGDLRLGRAEPEARPQDAGGGR
jgi:drug/metabolite transporter (DMT)-like permease